MAALATFVAAVGGCGQDEAAPTGGVSDAEFLAAAQAASDCVVAAGFESSGPEPASGGVGYVVGIEASGELDPASQAAMEEALADCWSTHVGDLEQRYYAGLQLSGEDRERAYGELVECLERAGVTGVEVGDPEEVVGDAVGNDPEAIECLQANLWQVFGDGTE